MNAMLLCYIFTSHTCAQAPMHTASLATLRKGIAPKNPHAAAQQEATKVEGQGGSATPERGSSAVPVGANANGAATCNMLSKEANGPLADDGT